MKITQLPALFKTTRALNIVGIGQVLTGQLIEGAIAAGDYVELLINGVAWYYEIDAVEKIEYGNTSETETALIFDLNSEGFFTELQQTSGKTIKVIARQNYK